MLEIWTSRGKLAITHFVTQLTHVSRHFRARNRKQKKTFQENCFENVVSEIHKKEWFCSYNSQRLGTLFYVFFLFFSLFYKSSFVDTEAFFF